MGGWVDGWMMDGWMDGCHGTQVDRWIDGWKRTGGKIIGWMREWRQENSLPFAVEKMPPISLVQY